MAEELSSEKLFQRAVERWGTERAEVLRPGLERLAESLRKVAENLPRREEDPAFFW